MSTIKEQKPLAENRKMGLSGLKAAFNILEKWGCSAEQMQAILRLPKATFYKDRNQPESARLDRDQLTRISYLLNIHQACTFSGDVIHDATALPERSTILTTIRPLKPWVLSFARPLRRHSVPLSA